MKLIKISLVLCVALATVSCKKYDSKVPAIESLTVNNVANGDISVITAGQNIDVAYTVSDNEDLQSISVTLVKGWEREPNKIIVDKDLLTYKLNRGLSGTKDNGSFDIAVPNFTQAGLYTLQVVVKDDENNSATNNYLLVVKNPNSPIKYNVTDIVPNGVGNTTNVRRSDVIKVSGTVTSTAGSLLKVTGAIVNRDALLTSFVVENFGGVSTFDLANVNPASATLDFQIPITAFSGKFYLVLQAQDSENNTTVFINPVSIAIF